LNSGLHTGALPLETHLPPFNSYNEHSYVNLPLLSKVKASFASLLMKKLLSPTLNLKLMILLGRERQWELMGRE
jgi:hypothetical protein